VCGSFHFFVRLKKEIEMSDYVHIVRSDTINPRVLVAKYEVRGIVTVRANELEMQLLDAKKKGVPSGLPFDYVTYCNIGNPQKLKQKPLTFMREVCALMEYPELIEKAPNAFAPDAIARAKRLLDTGFLTGTYSHSKGHYIIRQDIADFIAARDGFPCDPETIYCTDGASAGVRHMLSLLIRQDKKIGVMTPSPQYPLYASLLALNNGVQVGYALDEENGWSLKLSELERAYDEAAAKDVECRGLVIINPNNPTGNVLSVEVMQDIIRFCIKRRLVLFADEVYQENLYDDGAKFISFRKVAHDMGDDVFKRIEIASFHSISKGFLGECGHRGGYLQLDNFLPEVHAQLYKMVSIALCSNTMGQVVMDCMVNPPKPGEPSYELYQKEKTDIIQSLKRRAFKLSAAINSLEGFTCAKPSGAMYLFPSVVLPPKAIEAAKAANVPPDTFYALKLLEGTGICVVPGSGFGQREGTYHFRITFLPPEDQIDSVVESIKKFHAEFVAQYK